MAWKSIEEKMPPFNTQVLLKSGTIVVVGERRNDYKEFPWSTPIETWAINGTVWIEPTHWKNI